MNLIKSAVSASLITLLFTVLMGAVGGIGFVLWMYVHPAVAVVVGLVLFGGAYVVFLELSFRVGRNLGRYGRVFDLRDSGGLEW